MCQLSVCLVALLLGYSAARLGVTSVWPEWKTQKYATRFNASLLPLSSSVSPYFVNCRWAKSSFKK